MAKPLTLSLGEILWDVLPGGKALGGAPANAAWHLSQLGADARIVSAVGDDELGREILDRLSAMGLDAGCVSVLPGVPTSTVDAVVGPDGAATYTIHENAAWDTLPVSRDVLALAARADAVNFGSLAQRSAAGRAATHACLDAANPDAIKLFDINLRPPFIDAETLDRSLSRATVAKMNHDELPALSGLFGWTRAPENAMARLMEAYPNLRHVVVTRAENGAWWRTWDTLYTCPSGKIKTLVDTIGAGDCVTAAVAMGLLKHWKPQQILETAMEAAAFVCGSRGGTPELPAALVHRFTV